MKRTINLFAEVFALPFSGYFIENDPFVEPMKMAGMCKRELSSVLRIHNFGDSFDDVAVSIASELNRRVEINSLSELKNLLKRTFDAKSILRIVAQHEHTDERSILNLFYIELLKSVTTAMLTNRDGIAMLRPWRGSCETDFPFGPDDFGGDAEPHHAFFPQRIEIWNSLLRCIPEDMFISCYVATLVNKSLSEDSQRHSSMSILKAFGDSVHIADEPLDRVLDYGMAETHLHAGAAKTFGVVWEDMLGEAIRNTNVKTKPYIHIPYKQRIEQTTLQSTVLESAVVRMFLLAFLFSGVADVEEYLTTLPLSEPHQRLFQFGIPEICRTGHPSSPLSAQYVSQTPFFSQGSIMNDKSIWQIAGIEVAYQKGIPTLAEHCFLCWSILRIQRNPKDTYFIALFMYYLRMCSSVYRCHVHDSKNVGLDYFQKYYRASSDKGAMSISDNWQRILYTTLKDKRVVKTELRFSPRFAKAAAKEKAVKIAENNIVADVMMFMRQHLLAIVYRYGDNDVWPLAEGFAQYWRTAISEVVRGNGGALLRLLECFSVDVEAVHDHSYGIVYHFIKSGEKGEVPTCFANMNKAPDIERYKYFSFGQSRFQYECYVHALSNVRDTCHEISCLLVGIDAASLEIPTEPWVFAPAFRLARQRNSTLCYEQNTTANKALLGLTYHVGEDYNHPLSGLRHVYEAIDLLGMHAGDRLGHALVLGIDISQWFRKYELIALPRIEWMEDNLWLWHLFSSETELADIACYSKIVEQQILAIAKQIYGTTNGITIESLYQAYHRKAAAVDTVISRTSAIIDKCRAMDCLRSDENVLFIPCWNERNNTMQVWTTESLELSYHCSYYKHRMNEIIVLTDNEGYIQIAQKLQEYLRRKAAKKGLVIEANPSSNAVIGEMDGVLMHPAWQFRRRDGSHVMTSINTDDPLLFNANVANEHAYVYYALRYHGMSVEEALKEVDLMRKIGIHSSFIRESPKFSCLLKNYEEIIYSLNQKYRIKDY